MSKRKEILRNWKIWLYVVFFVVTMIAIHPAPGNDGVIIRSIDSNSTAFQMGMTASPDASPVQKERIVSINGRTVQTVNDFEDIVAGLPANATVSVTTESTKLFTSESFTYPGRYLGDADMGLSVGPAPQSNIRLGLDLQGGTRVVLQPEERVSAEDMDIILANMNQRLNVFGLSDIVIRSASDLAGNQFVIVEIAGANEEEVKDLLARQGKFEAKIGNETVFVGGKDITYVCRTPQCSGLDPQVGCRDTGEGTACRFFFQITLTPEAAQRQADITDDLSVSYEGGQSYLSQPLDLYLDNELVDSLQIGASLKGRPATNIVISGSGLGRSRQDALADMNDNMKRLQAILTSGSLPVDLDIIKTDALSPQLGREFLKNSVVIAILAELAVTAIIIYRYRRVKIALPIITVITSEILLILGMSALLKQNIDIAGIAGIIVAIGTGVDDQIVITDEILGGSAGEASDESWARRIKKAFFIVFAAYFATVAAMFPLLFAGAGLLKGFAITTIIGVTNGVFITRPAFAEMMKILLE